ncbi:hypothetical protein B005_3395 [Nocardiopsis alba ATCC BAA-2165]|uniref:Uncharacterized protein n=1 Tax=Nocardiopsis alba (strain ATCC BAA-2165 / BE74) TaxID=1205910 RepID=J7L0D2_NOCAA|nr:hypothetical protein B005_3395 [Nocardiopsis alba ATCC BAA-2165]
MPSPPFVRRWALSVCAQRAFFRVSEIFPCDVRYFDGGVSALFGAASRRVPLDPRVPLRLWSGSSPTEGGYDPESSLK